MDISLFDLCLINFVSYILGLGSGLFFCFKNKDKLLVKSRSLDNLSLQQNQHNQHNQHNQQNHQPYISPVMATAPPPDKVPIKITLE